MADKHFMNPQRGKHMQPAGEADQSGGQHKPSIHIHSHSAGHTMHVMHPDGRHEKSEHEHGDHEGMAERLRQHLGSSDSQSNDHDEDDGFAAEGNEGTY